MAEEDTKEQSVADAVMGGDDEEGGKGSGTIVKFALPVVVVALAAASGYFASRVAGWTPIKAGASAPDAAPSAPVEDVDYTYYENLAPLIVNPNTPGLTRHFRVTLTLAIRTEDYKAARKVIDRRKTQIKSDVSVYLADLTLEQIRGAKNLNRIRRHIQDMLNEMLWPQSRGLIAKVYFKDCAVN